MMERNGQDNLEPVVGITMVDPAGVGAEVVVKALADPELRRLGRFVVLGLNEMITYAADLSEIDPFWWRDQHENARRYPHRVVVADYDEYNVLANDLHMPTKEGGAISYQLILDACDLLKQRQLDALVTGPISKVSWKLAGIKYPGHTELLADQFKTKRVTMMFAAEKLRVALATLHLPLMDIRNRFTIGCVFQPIDLLHQALVNWFGVPRPRIAVAGLNPHASDEGRFGDEEARIIQPAITMAREAGIDVEGPEPADTLFLKAVRNNCYDGIVAMYHDQALIPVKLLAFDTAVNVTLGLPIIRTSPDHGTAFDIAGKNRANCGSMKAAIRLACQLARHQMQNAAAFDGDNP